MAEHKLASIPKYGIWKNTKNGTKALLLLKDDERPYMTAAQREDLLSNEKVAKAYGALKKERDLSKQPKVNINEAAGMSVDDLIAGIKNGTIVV